MKSKKENADITNGTLLKLETNDTGDNDFVVCTGIKHGISYAKAFQSSDQCPFHAISVSLSLFEPLCEKT